MTLFTSKLFLTYVYTVQPVKAMAHGAWLIKKLNLNRQWSGCYLKKVNRLEI